MSKSTGVLRVARSCGAGETAITWNQQGPAGPQGGRGSAGTSDVWTALNTSSAGLSSDPPSDVLPTLPTLPGSAGGTGYSVTAMVDAANDFDSSPSSATCTLQLGTASFSDTVQFAGAPRQPPHNSVPQQEGTLYLAVAATITTPTAPSLTCVAGPFSDDISAQQAELTGRDAAPAAQRRLLLRPGQSQRRAHREGTHCRVQRLSGDRRRRYAGLAAFGEDARKL